MKKIFVTLLMLLSMTTNCFAMTVQYTPLVVPNVNSSFKTYMDYRAVTNKASAQYKLLHTWALSDGNGFMRVAGERELGISEDYYCVALGAFYGTTMGTKYRFTTSTDNIFYGILSDGKGRPEVNSTQQYGMANKDVVEFLVYSPMLLPVVKKLGNAGAYQPLNGRIIKIERIDFVN